MRTCLRCLVLWLFLPFLPNLSTQGMATPSTLEAIRVDPTGKRVYFQTDRPPTAYSIEQLSDSTLQITLFNTRISPSLQRDPVHTPISNYTVWSPRVYRTQIVLELKHAVPETRLYSDPTNPSRLILEFEDTLSPPLATVGLPIDRDEPERWKLDCIVIDPGHGGKDPGTLVGNVYEKDIALAVAKKLGRYIEENLGIRVVYTREDDRFIELRERGHIANEAGGKLFISLHVNYMPGSKRKQRRVQGTETYFLGLHKSDAARSVMERENAVIKLESNPDFYASFDESALILQTLAHSSYLQASEQLAVLVEKEFSSRAKRISRGVKQAGFLVLWSASMPAILVELGYLSHPREAKFLQSERGQTLLASAIFRAVRTFKAEYEKGLDFALRQ